MSVDDLAAMSGLTADAVVADVDALADHNLLEAERASVKLHPLVSDYYWKQARATPDFETLVSRIADHAKAALAREKPDSVRFVNWLATACRALFLSNRPDEARALRRDFSGELKLAAIELYQRGDYQVSLKYCDAYLEEYPSDFEINFHRARNLSRIGRDEESLKIIDCLLEGTASPHRRARLHFARGRVFWETRKPEPAKVEFLKALDLSPNYLPALQGVSEALLTQGNIADASGFIERALKASPMDSHSLSMKADILWKRGQVQDAVDTMAVIVRAQPENATYLFRMGRFLQQSNLLEDAYKYFQRAKAADQSFVDPRLSLASTSIDLGRLQEARAEIDALKGRVAADKAFVLNEIEAKYHLALGEVELAADLASKALDYHRNAFTLSIMAKVEMAKYKNAQLEGMSVMADSHKRRAVQLVEEALTKDPTNPVLTSQLKGLKAS